MVIYVNFARNGANRTKFEPSKFGKIVNSRNKPRGGFWGSRIDAKYGWKEWNKESSFAPCDESNCVRFALKKGANIVEIHSVEDWQKFYDKYWAGFSYVDFSTTYFDDCGKAKVDFEQAVADGIDGIEVFISDDRDLYSAMYGWDCDSIVVFNKDVIVDLAGIKTVEGVDIEFLQQVVDEAPRGVIAEVSFQGFTFKFGCYSLVDDGQGDYSLADDGPGDKHFGATIDYGESRCSCFWTSSSDDCIASLNELLDSMGDIVQVLSENGIGENHDSEEIKV